MEQLMEHAKKEEHKGELKWMDHHEARKMLTKQMRTSPSMIMMMLMRSMYYIKYKTDHGQLYM